MLLLFYAIIDWDSASSVLYWKKSQCQGIKGKNGLRVLTSATLCLKKESIYLDEPSYDEVVLSWDPCIQALSFSLDSWPPNYSFRFFTFSLSCMTLVYAALLGKSLGMVEGFSSWLVDFGWLLNLTKNIQRCGLWVRPLNELLTKMASWKVNIHVNFQTQLLVHIKLEIRVCSLDFNVAGFWCKVQSSWLSKGFMSDFMLQWTKTLFMLL